MPEAPEVFISTQFLMSKLKKHTLKNIVIKKGKYLRKSPKGFEEFKKTLPLSLKNIESKGKQIWFTFNNENYMLVHYGMDGKLVFDTDNPYIEFKFDKQKTMFFTDTRNFGNIEFINGEEKLKEKIDSIGYDFLQQEFTNKDFKNRMHEYLFKNDKLNKSRGDKKIVEVLMQGQKKKTGIGSGIGNYLLAEILYRAKMSPHTKLIDIYNDDSKIKVLAYNIKYTMKLSLETNMHGYMEQHEKYLDRIDRNKFNFHPDVKIKKSDKFKYLVYRRKIDDYGNKVTAEKILNGRTTYWVKNVQL